MKAMVVTNYGGPEVLAEQDVPTPVPAKDEVLVKVEAAGVTTADWRIKGAEFPRGFSLIGRLMFGWRRPRQPVLGADFAGTVAQAGKDVEGFEVGQRVFGFAGSGAHAEYVTIKADKAIAPIPAPLSFEQAAALPFGMLAAHQFLTKFSKIKPGDEVLVVGASGGVGVYAVQIATTLGARVTAVASASNHGLLEELGAAAVVDYRQVDPLSAGPFDLIFDAVGVTKWRDARQALKLQGTYLPLNFAVSDVFSSFLSRFGSKRFVIGVNEDTRADLDALAPRLAEGSLRPVIDKVYRFDEIREAYAHVASRHRKGAVVLTMVDAEVAAA